MKFFPGLLIGLGCFIGLFAWSEFSNWTSEIARVEANLIRTSEALTRHADDVVEMTRLPLASLLTEIADEEGNARAEQKLQALIQRQMLASPTLDTLTFANAAGDVLASSMDPPSRHNVAEQDFFRFHRLSGFTLPVLGRPYHDQASAQWLIPVSQRVVRSDGSFGGVVLSTVRVYHFVDFVRHFNLGIDGSFLLARGDGFVLARAPMQASLLGTNISSHELFTQYLKHGNQGTYRYRSPVDGTERFGGYFRSTRTGLVVLAAASQDEVFETWIREAYPRWFYGAALLMLTLLAAMRWHYQARMRRAGEALLTAREAEFRLLAESSSDLIQRFNEQGIREYVSPSSLKILGVPADKLIGTSVFTDLHPEDAAGAIAAATRLKEGSPQETVLTRHVKPTGEEIWLDTAMSRLPTTKHGETPRAVAVTRDVTSQKKRQDELDVLAHSDGLTGLANRRYFDLRLDALLRQKDEEWKPVSLILIDADHFKQFNDTYGHAAGDRCLMELAEILHNVVRQDDVAARYGGEELAVLLPNTDGKAAEAIALRIQEKLALRRRPHAGNPPWERVTLSMGVSTADAPGGGQEALIRMADRALYKAKSLGRNRVVNAQDFPSHVHSVSR
ncbi:MAG: diguanylate cyclase [Alphaproteobacteria bacterium]|nr:diguanylate cyclase [Alphaproteobacteria bacterium]MBU1551586.1 diguanylate cyclase [Alphaproteobacteria bacterium]MBU2337321.1 diguanylate cyclase [Alphaproteobacteria bacterium]MBU2388064.1 diguanylate cyclase [Alphaproteobacteria bacterium]